MSARKTGKNFFEAHWDWLIAGAGVCIAALVFLLTGGEDEVASDNFTTGPGQKIDKIDMAHYESASTAFANPPQLEEIDGAKSSFLAAGLRVFCSPAAAGAKGCGMPIPFSKVSGYKCPYCGQIQREEEKPTEDHDSDGMPDDWENKYGFNPLDSSDADLDPDDDGFTNLEEFQAGTNPKDGKSHPDYLEDLKLSQTLNKVDMPFVFSKWLYRTPAGDNKVQFKFTNSEAAKELRKKFPNGMDVVVDKTGSSEIKGLYSYMGRSSEETTGFAVKTYHQQEVESKAKGSAQKTKRMERKVVVVRMSDGKEVTLVEGSKAPPLELKATVVFDRIASKGTQEFPVVDGGEFEINGNKYKVEKIEKLDGDNFQVTVESVSSGEKRTIIALEQ
ncbi:MAG: hypothetical protein K6F50_00415 [Kiritimatiellae bacterium]|nr:hypothetical protein [Kiritimatiellia bacterium]